MPQHPIRILYVTTSDRMAGAEKNMYDLLRLIDRNRYDPVLVIFKREKNGELGELVKELNIPVYHLGIQSKLHFFRLAKLWALIRSNKPTILESFLFFDNQVCRLFGTLLRVPIIISGQQNVESKRVWWRDFIDRLTMPLATCVISNSDAGKRYYVDGGYLPAAKAFVAKSGIDIAQIPSPHTSPVPRIIFDVSIPEGWYATVTVGFLTEQKGVSYLIRALAILKERGVNIQSFVIGQGTLEERLKGEAMRAGVADRVHFVGYRSRSVQYNHLFDCYVLSSLWEGLPNVVIEAMATRLPVVATAVGGLTELMSDRVTGLLVPPRNPGALAAAVQHMFSLSREEKERMVDAAYQKISSDYSVESMVRSYQHCYEHFS